MMEGCNIKRRGYKQAKGQESSRLVRWEMHLELMRRAIKDTIFFSFLHSLCSRFLKMGNKFNHAMQQDFLTKKLPLRS